MKDKTKIVMSCVSGILACLTIWLFAARLSKTFSLVEMFKNLAHESLRKEIIYEALQACALVLVFAFFIALNYLIWRTDILGTEAQRQERKAAAAARKKARLEKELEKLK